MAAVRRRLDLEWPSAAEPRAAEATRAPERHLVIAGTGRAGTSFLVRYLTELGLDTTLKRDGERALWDAEANAGLENLLVAGAGLPYVVKSPWIGEYVDQILDERRFEIDAFIVPVRDLVEAATSRVVLERRAIYQHNPWMAEQLDETWETFGHTAGGLVYSLNPLDQARLLAIQFHRLVLKASEAGVPIVFPVFPRIATDWRYLFECLRPVLPAGVSEERARAAHERVADAAKVRVAGEIARDRPPVAPGGQGCSRPHHFPTSSETDNIALRREVGRLQETLRQQVASAQMADQLRGEMSRLHAEFEQTVKALRDKLERKTLKSKLRRAFGRFAVARAIEA